MNGSILPTAATAFCGAVISARWWPVLPNIGWQFWLAVFALMTTVIVSVVHCNAKRLQKPLCFFCAAIIGTSAGLSVASSLGQSYLMWQQHGGEIQQDVIIEGRIVGYQRYGDYDRMLLTAVTVDQEVWDPVWAVQLNYYRPLAVFGTGQRIQARAKIKPARASANPAGFDMQRWYVSQRIVKTGYVRDQAIALVEPDTSVRGILKARIIALQLPGEKWLRALLFGEREGFSDKDWQLLQQTGTAHLFAISGLHLMIVAGAVLIVARGCAAFAAWLSLPLPANLVLALSLLLLGTGGFYAYLANWQIAVMRAYCSLLIVAVVYLFQRRLSRLTVVLLTLTVSIVLAPMSVYGAALYLSISAVAIIVWFHWWWNRSARQFNAFLAVVLLQVMLSVLMGPLVGALLGQASLISPLMNLLIVPVMSLLVIPLCLVGLFLLILFPADMWLTTALLSSCGTVIEWLMQQLQLIAGYIGDYSSVTVSTGGLLAGVTLAIVLVLLPPFKGRLCLLAVLFISCSMTYFRPSSSTSWQVHFFDVGQGNATLISHHGKAVLIDTGASFSSGFNFVEAVIQPFLNAGRLELVKVVVSHFDNDHAGGLNYIHAEYPLLPILTPRDYCVKGATWQFQTLQLQALWPAPEVSNTLSDNNGSCVLKISDGHYSVLLPGDIEQMAEQALLNLPEASSQLASTILVAPHHGSKTSSSTAFIEQVKPQFVVFSQGWLNRWGFPHETVTRRYDSAGSQSLLISQSGYLRFEISPGGVNYVAYRLSKDSAWYHKTFVND
ncbi:DNA internalization-related competence protein ComEC/Rec2 [uncultured Alteromonas sp.]|uniref:DNA internalization-related competence protein ComEC/Rec2 n=1 Tax=uncultured Alteromonas sp. TaxID=179113 RepID=UPI0025E99B62|nr:DNA internalization-related competence protein ComEC/Rec2 [uncultured Alteromonas sp.]